MRIETSIIVEAECFVVHEIYKMNQKATKLGCPQITFTKVSEPYLRLVTSPEGDMFLNQIDIVIEGEAIKYNGYRFLGRVEATEGSDNLLFTVPGEVIPEEYRNCDPYRCQHCNIDRFRKATWVVAHDSGTTVQVGSACLKDFVDSTQNPERVIAWWMNSVEELVQHLQKSTITHRNYYGYWDEPMINSIQTLEVACAFTRLAGKYEFESEYKDSTSAKVWNFYRDSINVEISEEDRIFASQIVEYVNSKAEENTYFKNLSTVFKADRVQMKNIKFITSSVYSFIKAHPKVSAEKNEVFGTIGNKVKSLKLTVLKNISVYNSFTQGENQMLILKDADGRSFKWVKTSPGHVDENIEIVLNGSIKKHNLYNGIHQTVLTRGVIHAN